MEPISLTYIAICVVVITIIVLVLLKFIKSRNDGDHELKGMKKEEADDRMFFLEQEMSKALAEYSVDKNPATLQKYFRLRDALKKLKDNSKKMYGVDYVSQKK